MLRPSVGWGRWESVHSFEKPVHLNQTARCRIPEHGSLYSHRRENLKPLPSLSFCDRNASLHKRRERRISQRPFFVYGITARRRTIRKPVGSCLSVYPPWSYLSTTWGSFTPFTRYTFYKQPSSVTWTLRIYLLLHPSRALRALFLYSGKGKIVVVRNKYQTMKTWCGGKLHAFLTFGTRWKLLVSFVHLSLYFLEKCLWCAFNRRVTELALKVWRSEDILPVPGIEVRYVGSPNRKNCAVWSPVNTTIASGGPFLSSYDLGMPSVSTLKKISVLASAFHLILRINSVSISMQIQPRDICNRCAVCLLWGRKLKFEHFSSQFYSSTSASWRTSVLSSSTLCCYQKYQRSKHGNFSKGNCGSKIGKHQTEKKNPFLIFQGLKREIGVLTTVCFRSWISVMWRREVW